MKLISRVSPNYRDKRSTLRVMIELTIGLLVVLAASVFFYFTKVSSAVGIRALLVVLTAVVTNVVCEGFIAILGKKDLKSFFKSQFPWVSGLIFGLCVPVDTRFYVVIIATIIGVLFGKVVFGGFGQNIFNPAGVARAIVFTSFAQVALADVTTKIADTISTATPATTMSMFNWLPSAEIFGSKTFDGLRITDLLFGNHFGAIGETVALVIIIVGVILAIRKVIDWRISLSYIVTLFLMTMVVGLVNGQGLWLPTVSVLSGGAMFAAVFMLTDPVTSPTQMTGRYIFGIGAAVLTFLIRFKANLPEGVIFSILIMNMLTPLIEDTLDSQQIKAKKKFVYGLIVMVVVSALATTWVAATTKVSEPIFEAGTQVKLSDEKLAKYEATIVDTKTDGNKQIFTVSVKGYAMVESEYPKETPNEFEITVEGTTVVEIKMIKFGDTKNIGDAVDNMAYFKTFEGLSLVDEDVSVDTVSSATITSYSLLNALNAVRVEVSEVSK